MNKGIVQLNVAQFALVYVLLLVVLAIMKKSKVDQSKLLFTASLRMSVQLVLAGFVLTYIFQNPKPIFTVLYLLAMTGFAIHRVLSKNPHMNRRFQWIVALSLGGSGLLMVAFFVAVIVRVSVFNPQYTIPLSGMIIGNAMTGLNLGLHGFHESLRVQKNKVETLLNLGVHPDKILAPFANQALETALLPTLNSMLGMGVVSLPGMMTGQILSGTLPTTAILYQIAIMISICSVVCIAVYTSLFLGYRTLYNRDCQIQLPL